MVGNAPRPANGREHAALPDDPAIFSAIGHLYSADAERSLVYRRSLDATTGWAINLSLIVTVFALANPPISHLAFLVLMLADFGFLHVEASRCAASAYSAARRRMLLVQTEFFTLLERGSTTPALSQALIEPLGSRAVLPNYLEVVGSHVRRGYLWILSGVLLGWFTKLNYLGSGTWNASDMLTHAGVGALPGWTICVGVGAFYCGLAVLAVIASLPCDSDDDGQYMALGRCR